MIYGLVIAIPFIFFKDIKEASFLSVFGMITTAVAVIVICVYSGIEITTTKNTIANGIKPIEWKNITSSLSIFVFSFSGSFIFPDVEGSMKNKKNWNLSLLISMAFIFFCYLTISLLGGLAYGTDASEQIYDNIEGGIPVGITLIFAVLHFLFATPIFLCSLFSELETKKLKITKEKFGKSKEFIIRFILRLSVIILITMLSIFADNFQFASTLIGAFSTSILIFVVPGLSYLKLYGYKGKPIWEYVTIGFMVVFGLTMFLYGTYEAIYKEYFS